MRVKLNYMNRYLAFLEESIFYILVFAIPFQTRKIFYFLGESFNEWMSVSLYWTDILIFALLIFWMIRIVIASAVPPIGGTSVAISRERSDLRHRSGLLRRSFHSLLAMTKGQQCLYYFLLAFLGWAGVSVFFSTNTYLIFYNWVKLIEVVFIFIYVRDFIKSRGLRGLANILWVFVLSAFFQASVAIMQFINQGSLGLQVFHESPMGILKDGVAKLNFANFQLIRSYGTFPHPNVLGAFLGLAIFFSYWLWLRDDVSKFLKYILLFIISVIFAGLFFTFSRSAIIMTVVLSTVFLGVLYFSGRDFYKKKKIRELMLIIFLFIAVLILLFQPFFTERFNINLGEQAVNLRAFYTKVALEFIGQSPFFGVGIGNFVSELIASDSKLETWAYQPAHNLYLLIASEIGIVGLILFVGFIGLSTCRLFNSLHRSSFAHTILVAIVLCSMFYVLGLGLFDHYFWTLQQGRLIMWLVFSMAAF